MNLKDTFWQDLKANETDLETLYNHLLEIETPQTTTELTSFFIQNKINDEKKKIDKAKAAAGDLYMPKNQFKVGQKLVFPMRNMAKGTVRNIREGHNPDCQNLQIIEVDFAPDEKAAFASNLAEHKLNDASLYEDNDPNLDFATVVKTYGSLVSKKLDALLEANEDLVCIAGSYFPRSLLVDISPGHLNLAEAVLEMETGGPMSSQDLIKQIELPTNVNTKLTEFSFNLAMQEDNRFDEVGPAGITLWFLKRLEPAEVQNCPVFLQYSGEVQTLDEDIRSHSLFDFSLNDELEPGDGLNGVDAVTISLIYPHLRAGTLPLTIKLKKLFPTAYETPHIKFDFIDGKTKTKFPGWVVRPFHYIYGLADWYSQQGIIPGSLIRVSRGANRGEVVIEPENQHNSREWVRTVLVGADGGIVFATLKQQVTCSYDERMVVMTPDFALLDPIWERYADQKYPLEKVVIPIMRDLAKLNPQGHIHAQELYSAVNVLRRCPPSAILELLFTKPWASHMGDLYFKLVETKS